MADTIKVRNKETGEILTLRMKDSTLSANEGIKPGLNKDYLLPQFMSRAEPLKGQQNLWGDIGRPAAAIRGEILNPMTGNLQQDIANQGKGFVKGWQDPASIPSLQSEALKYYYSQTPDFLGKTALGNVVSATGLAADVATDPTTYLSAGVLKLLSKTPVAKPIMNFLTKERRFLKFGKDAVLDVAEKASKGERIVKTTIGKKYDTFIDDIGKSTKDSIDRVGLDEIKGVADSILNEFPNMPNKGKIAAISERLANTDKLSARELLNLKQEAKLAIGKSVLEGKVKPNAIQATQSKLVRAIDEKILDLGGDKYKSLKLEYRDYANMIDDVNSIILERGRPGDIKLRGTFLNPGGSMSRRQFKSLESLSKQLPAKDQFMQEFLAWKRGQLLKRYGLLPIAAGVGYQQRDRLLDAISGIGGGESVGGGE